MKSDANVSIENLKVALKRFRDETDWRQFHDPKNLAEAISIEAAELLELFRWRNPTEIVSNIRKDKALLREIENELAFIKYNGGLQVNASLLSVVLHD